MGLKAQNGGEGAIPSSSYEQNGKQNGHSNFHTKAKKSPLGDLDFDGTLSNSDKKKIFQVIEFTQATAEQAWFELQSVGGEVQAAVSNLLDNPFTTVQTKAQRKKKAENQHEYNNKSKHRPRGDRDGTNRTSRYSKGERNAERTHRNKYERNDRSKIATVHKPAQVRNNAPPSLQNGNASQPKQGMLQETTNHTPPDVAQEIKTIPSNTTSSWAGIAKARTTHEIPPVIDAVVQKDPNTEKKHASGRKKDVRTYGKGRVNQNPNWKEKPVGAAGEDKLPTQAMQAMNRKDNERQAYGNNRSMKAVEQTSVIMPASIDRNVAGNDVALQFGQFSLNSTSASDFGVGFGFPGDAAETLNESSKQGALHQMLNTSESTSVKEGASNNQEVKAVGGNPTNVGPYASFGMQDNKVGQRTEAVSKAQPSSSVMNMSSMEGITMPQYYNSQLGSFAAQMDIRSNSQIAAPAQMAAASMQREANISEKANPSQADIRFAQQQQVKRNENQYMQYMQQQQQQQQQQQEHQNSSVQQHQKVQANMNETTTTSNMMPQQMHNMMPAFGPPPGYGMFPHQYPPQYAYMNPYMYPGVPNSNMSNSFEKYAHTPYVNGQNNLQQSHYYQVNNNMKQ